MEKSIVRISNLLNFTRQEFDVYEQRLLILIIEFLKHKQKEYVTATQAIGSSHFNRIFKHNIAFTRNF